MRRLCVFFQSSMYRRMVTKLLKARVIKEPNIPGSRALGETEIPQLQPSGPLSVQTVLVWALK